MSQSGINNIDLTKLSSAASSNYSSRDPSLDSNNQGKTTTKQNQNNTQGRNNNKKGRRRSLTPHKSNRSNNFRKNQNKQTPNSSRSKSQRSYSRDTRRRYLTLNSKSYQKQASKKRAWKSQVCKYLKKGCKFGDECEWQHYDQTQIDFCEQRKKKRYNQTNAEGQYLVQITIVQHMREEQIMALIGNPSQMKQSIAIAVKNKRQSKLMKKEIMKELKKGKLNDEEKINMKKRAIKKYIAHMQIDVANQIVIKRIKKNNKESFHQKKKIEKSK